MQAQFTDQVKALRKDYEGSVDRTLPLSCHQQSYHVVPSSGDGGMAAHLGELERRLDSASLEAKQHKQELAAAVAARQADAALWAQQRTLDLNNVRPLFLRVYRRALAGLSGSRSKLKVWERFTARGISAEPPWTGNKNAAATSRRRNIKYV